MNSLSYKILILSSILFLGGAPGGLLILSALLIQSFFLAGGFLYIIRINAQHILQGMK